MKNMEQILGDVMSMNNSELNQVIEAINSRRKNLSDAKKMSFKVGQEVFIDMKEYTSPFIIIKILKKNIRVASALDKTEEYDVSPSLLITSKNI